MKIRLTDLAIRKLPLSEKGQLTHWDLATPGFGVRCSTRSKSFVVMYGEKRRLRTIGRYPELSLSEARRAARRFLATADDRADASGAPALSFAEARDRFLEHCEGHNKPRTVQTYRRLLNRHFAFKKDLEEIERADVTRMLSKLSATPGEQQHAYVALRTMLNWCVAVGFLENSPMPRVRQKTTSRDRVLTDEELAAVYRRAKETPFPYGPIVELLILTGQRRGEVVGMRRSWIEDGVLTFPTGFTKNKREHRLPLSPMALEVIDDLPEFGDLLFPSRDDCERPFSGWGKCKERFDEALPFNDYVLHDLRRTFSSNMARLSVPIHVTEKILNHVTGAIGGIAAVYNRYSYFDEMAAAVEKHDAFLRATTDYSK